VRGCAATATGGACGVTVDCATFECGLTPDPMTCEAGCAGGAGPGPSGYYQPTELPVLNSLWSSTMVGDSPAEAWRLEFYQAAVLTGYAVDFYEGRCVRTGL
jgi:hypothetical protein